MQDTEGFYTLKGYQHSGQGALTPAMEDYLEMICRLLRDRQVVRMGELAATLHVQPPSATKMIQQLHAAGYVTWKKYGYIGLTDQGREMGDYLLARHALVQRFLRYLNGEGDQLEQVEKIEHFLDRRTVENLGRLLGRLEGMEGLWPGKEDNLTGGGAELPAKGGAELPAEGGAELPVEGGAKLPAEGGEPSAVESPEK